MQYMIKYFSTLATISSNENNKYIIVNNSRYGTDIRLVHTDQDTTIHITITMPDKEFFDWLSTKPNEINIEGFIGNIDKPIRVTFDSTLVSCTIQEYQCECVFEIF